MTIQEMLERKKELGYSNETLSKLSGIPVSTVQKVLGGFTASPRQKTLENLSKVLSPVSMVRETGSSYQAQPATATIEDVYALPDGVRAELIDGRLYYMTSPMRLHQEIISELHVNIANYIRSKGGKCKVYEAPFNVRLAGDDSIYVEPDLSVICDLSKLDDKGCLGAPDWVIEVLSPSTQNLDLGKKLVKYRECGVREYWIIDLRKKIVIVHLFGWPQEPAAIYGFEDEIPCGVISGLKITLDELLA